MKVGVTNRDHRPSLNRTEILFAIFFDSSSPPKFNHVGYLLRKYLTRGKELTGPITQAYYSPELITEVKKYYILGSPTFC